MCVGTISEKDKRKHKSKYLELKSFFRCLVLSSQQRSVQWCGYLHLDNEPPSCLQHRKSGDQYKMQYIVSMFILIRCFNHQSSAQSTFYCNLNFHDFYPPALSMVAEAARWRYGGGRLPALITRRLEAGGRIPVRNIPRNLPRLRNLPSAEQLPLVRRRGGSGPLITTTNLPNLPPITARLPSHQI